MEFCVLMMPVTWYYPAQVWESRSCSELWDDAEGVFAPWAFGADSAVLWRVLLLLPLRGALNLWHRLRRFRFIQGTLPYFYPKCGVFTPAALSWSPLFPVRISSQDTRLCVLISWRRITTGWAFECGFLFTSVGRLELTCFKMSLRCSQNMRSSCILTTMSPNGSLWR